MGRKDSPRTIEATGEFAVGLAPEPLPGQINAGAVDFPAEADEFDGVGIEREPSPLVAPPRVAASPVALECRLHSTPGIGSSTLVLGRVVHAAVHEDAVVDGRPDTRRPRPPARPGGEWSTVGEAGELARVPCRDRPRT